MCVCDVDDDDDGGGGCGDGGDKLWWEHMYAMIVMGQLCDLSLITTNITWEA